jgi:hypothetical protein
VKRSTQAVAATQQIDLAPSPAVALQSLVIFNYFNGLVMESACVARFTLGKVMTRFRERFLQAVWRFFLPRTD